ncbi:Holliday junction resolvase RuvX [bacterium]|nr:Holliday junction resolvase RuvX [bacterium]
MEELPRILGLDIGTKRTGVAVSDATRFLGSPLCTIEERDPVRWVTQVLDIINKEEVGTVVVGIPLNQYGEEGRDAVRIRSYVSLLRKRTPLPVVEWDERYTTVQAERSLISADLSRQKRKLVIDRVAATIILQGYLDSQRGPSEEHWH